nr:unnamed protein product [Trichobilharzia regenti]
MFETYRVPKLLYYVDCLASFYNYQQSHSPDQTTNCLVVSFGYQTTHIVPIMPALSEKNISSGFRPLIQAARRLQVGGAHASWMLQRLLQLKYPCHSDSISGGLSEHLAHSYCHLASNYRQEMIQWKSKEFRSLHTIKVQLPFNKPSDEELKALADRKRAQAERLLSTHRKRQKQQLESAQCRLAELEKVKKLLKQEDSPIVKQIISNLGLSKSTDVSQEMDSCRRIIDKLEAQLNPVIKSEDEPINQNTSKRGQLDIKSKFAYSHLLDRMYSVYTNSFSTVTNELTGRHKRAAELLISQSLPSAVQSQMTLNTNMSNFKFTEAKLRNRIRIAEDLEFSEGEDFILWLSWLRDRRAYISKKRTQRQSRVDLATQIGLHSNDGHSDIGSDSVERIPQLKASLSTMQTVGSNTTGRNGVTNDAAQSGSGGDKYDDSKKVMTERRRMQLEKIRAMAAELKPTRGRSRGAGKSVRPGVSRGASKSRGRGRKSLAEYDSRITAGEINPDDEDNETLGDDCSDMLGLDDPTETEQTTSSSTGLNRLWDPDCEDDTNDELNGSSGMKKVPATSDYRMDVADESEEERDELAVMDSLLALYDPEASKDLGITDLKVELDRYYQIHVDTEQVRSHEVLFQPSFIGHSEAGFSECLEYVLRDTKQLIDDDKDNESLAYSVWPEKVYLTGGVAALPGLVERIRYDIRPLLPVGSKWDDIEIVVAANPQLDAWYGARRFANSPLVDENYITRKIVSVVQIFLATKQHQDTNQILFACRRSKQTDWPLHCAMFNSLNQKYCNNRSQGPGNRTFI